jgi:hypothetical protein
VNGKRMSNDGVPTTRHSRLLTWEKHDDADTGSALAGCYVIVPERLEHSELYWPLERLVEKEGGTLGVDSEDGTRGRTTRHLIEPD